MATTSYGKITIIDVTDVGNFSVYPYANGPNTQIYSEETNAYSPDWSANGSHLILTPVVTYAGQDKTNQATVDWYLKTDLEHPITTGFDSINKTLTVSTNIPTANTYIVYVVKASYNTETGAHVEAEGEITFSLLTQSSSVKNVNITGTNVIKYASDSTVPNPASITLTAALVGGDYITGDGWKYWDGDSWENVSGVTGLSINNLQLTLNASYNNSAAYFNNDIAKFKYVAHATYDNADIYEDIFTVFQLRDGASGSSLVTMDLTNDDQSVPLDTSGVAQWSAIGDLASTTVYVYRSTDNITTENPITATLTNVSVELYNGNTKYSGNWTSGQALPAGYYKVKVTGFTNDSTSGSISFATTVYDYSETSDTSVQSGTTYYTKNALTGIYSAVVNPTGNPTSQNWYVRGGGKPCSAIFSLVGISAGKDGQTPTIYALDFPSIPAYVNNPTGSAATQTLQDNWTYSPANLTINAYQITTNTEGVSARSPYSGRVWYKPNLSNGVVQTGDSEWGSLTLTEGTGTLPASSKLLVQYSPYIFRLVGPNEDNIAANLKDEESVNILSDGNIGNDGNDGNDAINLLIDNENVTLNATVDGKTRVTNIVVGYQGYIGATENANFQLNTSNKGSSSKSGLVTINNITTNTTNKTVTIPINANVSVVKGETGTITLNFLYTGVTPNLTIQKVISWDAKLDAQDGADGADAIVLTFEYGGNKTTYFKNETGSTTVTPILLQNGTNLLAGKTPGTDFDITWTDLIDNTKTVSVAGTVATISATDISGVGSYSCTITYPKTNGKNYTQYVSFTDYSDPLQVELISTIGDKLTNGVGEGVIYPQTTRDGVVLDQVSTNSLVVWGSASAPSSPADGDFYFNTSSNILYERVSGQWTSRSNYAQIIVLRTGNVNPIELRTLSSSTYPAPGSSSFSNLTYVWSFRDKDGNVINPNSLTDLKVSYKDATHSAEFTTTQVTGGQFIYINKNVVSNKIIVLCQVTKN